MDSSDMSALQEHFPKIARGVVLRRVLLETVKTWGFKKDDFDLNPHIGIQQCADEIVSLAGRQGVTTTRDEIMSLWIAELYNGLV